MLQRPLPPVGPSSLPVVIRPVSGLRWVVLGGVVVALIFAGVVALVPIWVSDWLSAPPAGTLGARGASPSWHGRPVLADVDGDGIVDIIGNTRYVRDGDQIHVAAFSGTSGALLWESSAVGTHSNTLSSRLASVADRVLVSKDDGQIHAYTRATGAAVWTAALGDKVVAYCANAEAAQTVVVATLDGHAHQLDLRTGERSPAAPLVIEDEWQRDDDRGPRCIRIPDNSASWTGRARRSHLREAAEIVGFRPDLFLELPNQGLVALGMRTPGSSVPMLAGFDAARRASWTVEIPSRDALNTSVTDESIVIAGDLIAVIYIGRDNKARLAAFALANGSRRWDVAVSIDPTFGGISVTQRTVLVAGGNGLEAFDLASGKLQFKIAD